MPTKRSGTFVFITLANAVTESLLLSPRQVFRLVRVGRDDPCSLASFQNPENETVHHLQNTYNLAYCETYKEDQFSRVIDTVSRSIGSREICVIDHGGDRNKILNTCLAKDDPNFYIRSP